MKSRVTAAFAACVALCGCGTVVRGTSEPVYISAYPAHARITTSLGHQCPMSPCTLTIDRKTKFTAYAEAQGYKPGTIQIGTKVAGSGAVGMAGNVVVGGVIGVGVDAVTGAALDHDPNPAMIILEPVDAANPDTPAMTDGDKLAMTEAAEKLKGTKRKPKPTS